MTYITIAQDNETYTIRSNGEDEDIIVMLATAMTQDQIFMAAWEVAQAYYLTYGRGEN